MLLRLIFFLFLLFGILLFARIVLRKVFPPIDVPHVSPPPPSTDLIQCAYCKVFFNKHEGVFKKGMTFCSLAHYQAHE